MSSQAGFPSSTQRPQLISRFELPQSSQSSTQGARGVGVTPEPERQVGTAVQGVSTQVAQRVFEAQRLNFPTESAVMRFRGDVTGRELAGVSGGQSITKLPSQVTPFNPTGSSEVISSFNQAELAAVGFQREAPSVEFPPIIGSGSAERAASLGQEEPSFEERFPGLPEGRFPGVSSSSAEERAEGAAQEVSEGAESAESSQNSQGSEGSAGEPTKLNGEPLTSEEAREVERLEQRDAEVRAHEQAHASAAGRHARGGMKLSYTTGPDGQRYATEGEVGVDLSPESTPEGTISKMQTIRRAALAPAQPSSADRAAAAAASQREQQARVELREVRQEELKVQSEQMKGSREAQREEDGTARAAEVEVNEGAESFAGAQAVQPEVASGPKAPSLEPRSLDLSDLGDPLATPSDISRPVDAPSAPRSAGPQQAVMRSPSEDESPTPSKSERSEV